MCVVAVCSLFPEFQVSTVLLRQQLISKPKYCTFYKDLFSVVSERTQLSTGMADMECVFLDHGLQPLRETLTPICDLPLLGGSA